MHQRIKKIIGLIHLWLGLISGIVVFVVSITGCIYVFQKELRFVFYDYLKYEVDGSNSSVMRPVSELIYHAEDAIGHRSKPKGIAYHPPGQSHWVQFFKFADLSGRGPLIWYWEFYDHYYRVYLNPITGKVIHVEDTAWEFFQVVQNLHTNLLMGPLGEQIVSISTIVFVLMLITGIVLWWPKNRKSLKRATGFYWKKGTKWKRKNFDLHNVPGFYTLFITLIIAISGLTMSEEWLRNSLGWIFNGGSKFELSFSRAMSDPTQLNDSLGIDKVYASIPLQYPNSPYSFMVIPNDSISPIRTVITLKEDIPQYRNVYDQYSGALLDSHKLSDSSGGEQYFFSSYSIHVGSIWGLPGKILAFLGSLISASLPVTGFFIWWGRKRKKNTQPHVAERSLVKNSSPPILSTPQKTN